jgi:uncharacterized protein
MIMIHRGKNTFTALITLIFILIFHLSAAAEPERRYEVIIVGAGIAGLSAAWELSKHGVSSAVIELSQEYCAAARMSEGGISIVGTPEQEQGGEPDSPELAFADFVNYGRDEDGPGPNLEWVRYYVNESRHEIYDWLIGLGVAFEKKVVLMPGNSVPRWHKVVGKGKSLMEPIYRDCIEMGKVTFIMGTKVISLMREGNRITGVRAEHTRGGTPVDYYASEVILATGGFQSNLKMVHQYWPKDLPYPERFLTGGWIHATGSGHEMAQAVGGKLTNMQYQLNYPTGLPNPSGMRGINAYNDFSIWVNKTGRRFMRESRDTRVTFPEVLKQPGSTYWTIFDSASREHLHISGWTRPIIEKGFFENPQMKRYLKSADTISDLARAAGLPPDVLEETLKRWNKMVEAKNDEDFGRIGSVKTPWGNPPKIETPPFYAVQFFPMTRKSMGGVAIDMSCRVLDGAGKPIPGLYAVGELTGLAGVNGKASTEGTFLGACILTGRVAGRAIASERDLQRKKDLPK